MRKGLRDTWLPVRSASDSRRWERPDLVSHETRVQEVCRSGPEGVLRGREGGAVRIVGAETLNYVFYGPHCLVYRLTSQ
jgi:hypothetical protein